ncbi:MAG: phosphatase PAP2 family protein [Acidobacteriota bacterium]|nr:phosphatase PAP2 family protein [Acidobacteriota bacterium]
MSRRPKFPTVPIPAAFDPLDAAVDRWFESRLRHRRSVDVVMYGASAVGDHGVVWLGLAGIQALRRNQRGETWARPFLRTAIGLGVESVVVNGPVKFVFRRTRPLHEGPRPLHLRQPRTSSFPSGHATAAFFGAALLRDDDPLWPVYYALAVIVAASRVHVRIHHASDVIGGVITGIALGELTRRLVPVAPPSGPVPPEPTTAVRAETPPGSGHPGASGTE